MDLDLGTSTLLGYPDEEADIALSYTIAGSNSLCNEYLETFAMAR
jgi:hypothetical protein